MNESFIMDDEPSLEPLTNNDSQTATVEATYRPVVHYPRSVWFEFVLGLITLTLSWCFWAVGRANDVKNMRSNDYSPWAWFFVPLVVFAQLFAFPRMFEELSQIEGDRVNTRWRGWGSVWIALMVISGVIAGLPDWLGIEWWIVFVCIGIGHLLLCLLHIRFNTLKEHDAQLLEFQGRKVWYYWWEWLLMSIFMLIWGVLAYDYWTIEQETIERQTIEDLSADYSYLSTDNTYQLNINGVGWRRVEIGAISDGSALVEFGGKSSSAYLLVFKHGDDNDDLNSISRWRFKDMQPDFKSKPSCNENREFAVDQLSVVSTTVCSLEKGRDHEVSVSKVIKHGDEFYELLGFAREQKDTYKHVKKTLLDAAKSFSVVGMEAPK